MGTYIVYIKIDSSNYVISVNSSAFISDTTNWILIDEGTGDKYHHAQGNYFDKPLFDENGCHNYIYVDGVVREITLEEKTIELESFPTPEPTAEERISQLELLILQMGGIL